MENLSRPEGHWTTAAYFVYEEKHSHTAFTKELSESNRYLIRVLAMATHEETSLSAPFRNTYFHRCDNMHVFFLWEGQTNGRITYGGGGGEEEFCNPAFKVGMRMVLLPNTAKT